LRQIVVFVDGVGLGESNGDNPFYSFETPGFSQILEGRRLTAENIGFRGKVATLAGLDACLGVAGFPQSATGQASIFTGINAAAYLGQHLNGFPDHKLRGLLAEKGIFSRLRQNNYTVCFANAYRPEFFELLDQGLPGEHYSCSTLVTYYGGLKFFGFEELNNGHALYMDITNGLLRKMGYDLPLITPEEGAKRLINISHEYDFCLFEYFLSDLAGHLGEEDQVHRVIETLDRFLGTLAFLVDPVDTLLILCSDHGNLEDSSGTEHTLNRVPLLLVGDPELRRLLELKTEDLTDLIKAFELSLAWKGNALC
jgi:2,3-bisphosphoglycerate-independent phosphoglycerate mutase